MYKSVTTEALKDKCIRLLDLQKRGKPPTMKQEAWDKACETVSICLELYALRVGLIAPPQANAVSSVEDGLDHDLVPHGGCTKGSEARGNVE